MADPNVFNEIVAFYYKERIRFVECITALFRLVSLEELEVVIDTVIWLCEQGIECTIIDMYDETCAVCRLILLDFHNIYRFKSD